MASANAWLIPLPQISLSYICTVQKVIAHFLTALYLITTIGVSLSLHYCHGNLTDITFSSHAADCCCAKFQKANNCCDDQLIAFQIDDEHVASTHPQLLSLINFNLPIQFVDRLDNLPRSDKNTLPIRPPPKRTKARLSLTSSFVFYG